MIKLALAGVGHLGKIHLKLLKELEGIEFIGIYDINSDLCKQTAKQFNVNYFKSFEALCANADAVSIVTSTTSHYELALKALESNLHIFIEKPIAAEIWQAEELVKLANEKKLKLQVGHIERFNPALISLEKYFLNPLFIQTDRLSQFNPRGTDVAVVLDLMIHDIDIILSLIKSKVKNIYASGVAVVSGNIDIANARIEFENGAVANVTASRISQKKMRKMRIFQKSGYVSIDFITGAAEVYRLLDSGDKLPEHFISFGEMGVGKNKKLIVYEQPETPRINAMKYELELFVKSIRNNTKPVVSGEDGLRALKIAEMIIKKINEKKIV